MPQMRVLAWLFHQGKVEAEAAIGTIADCDVAAMKLHRVFNNGKAEAGAAHATGSTFVHAIKTFEQARQLFFFYTTAIIFKADVTRP